MSQKLLGRPRRGREAFNGIAGRLRALADGRGRLALAHARIALNRLNAVRRGEHLFDGGLLAAVQSGCDSATCEATSETESIPLPPVLPAWWQRLPFSVAIIRSVVIWRAEECG